MSRQAFAAASVALVLSLVQAVPRALAHHGVASLGVAGLEGPGAPIETSSSVTLPQGKLLAYVKLDYASFEKYTPTRDDEGDYNAFWIYGCGYGFSPYLSAYVFAPFYTKKVEDNSFNTSGFADLIATVVLGFKYDDGLRLIPRNESLDDLEDWHFTCYAGLTLPTGDANVRDASGGIDPGMSLGFGRPSYTLGLTGTKQFAIRCTGLLDASFAAFSEYEYADGTRSRFGDELRINSALSIRALTEARSRFRLDVNLEGNLLRLGRDRKDGLVESATGGTILYVTPGLRAYYRSGSVGLGLKVPAWTSLNESGEQQGCEGKERFRLVLAFSALL